MFKHAKNFNSTLETMFWKNPVRMTAAAFAIGAILGLVLSIVDEKFGN